MKKQPKKLVIFASGTGSNALNIIKYFKNNPYVKIESIFCNNSKAKVLEKAKSENVNTFLFTKQELQNTDTVYSKLNAISPDLIILAGFLLKIPENIISMYQNKIINLHPALLPKYGGKGMYGEHVHRAVLHNKEPETGISIHLVNPIYDDGQILAQFKISIDTDETVESLQDKIHTLEHQHFPKVIDKLLKDGKA